MTSKIGNERVFIGSKARDIGTQKPPEVWGGGCQGSGGWTSLTSLPPPNSKRVSGFLDGSHAKGKRIKTISVHPFDIFPQQKTKKDCTCAYPINPVIKENVCTIRWVCDEHGDMFASYSRELWAEKYGEKNKKDLSRICDCAIKAPMHTVGYHEALKASL